MMWPGAPTRAERAGAVALAALGQKGLEEIAGSSDEHLRAAAGRRSENPAVLEKLAGDESALVAELVGRNPNLIRAAALVLGARRETETASHEVYLLLEDEECAAAIRNRRGAVKNGNWRGQFSAVSGKPKSAKLLFTLLPAERISRITVSEWEELGQAAQEAARGAVRARIRGMHVAPHDKAREKKLGSVRINSLLTAASAVGLEKSCTPAGGDQGEIRLRWWANPSAKPDPTSEMEERTLANFWRTVAEKASGEHLEGILANTSSLSEWSAGLLRNPHLSAEVKLELVWGGHQGDLARLVKEAAQTPRGTAYLERNCEKLTKLALTDSETLNLLLGLFPAEVTAAVRNKKNLLPLENCPVEVALEAGGSASSYSRLSELADTLVANCEGGNLERLLDAYEAEDGSLQAALQATGGARGGRPGVTELLLPSSK